MTTVAQRLNEVKSTLPATGVQLVAVSKFHPAETIREAYDAGHRCFGESRAQELQQKYDQLPHDIEWHFIGHLQTNKVKYIIPYVAMIHSVDSPRILDEIERQAARVDRVVDCLLPHVRFRGIMGMASNTDDDVQVRAEFAQLKQLFDTVRGGVMAGNDNFDTLSMGMSLDYRMAIEEGSTMVRIGTTIFGEREY